MKALSLPQPYAIMSCVSGEYTLPRPATTDHRGKVLLCAGAENYVPEFEGVILNHALCVAELSDVREITPEELEQMGPTENRYAWTLVKPRLIVPIPVEQQEGLFDIFADIEYLGNNAQFKAAYAPFTNEGMSPDVLNLYNLLMEVHAPEESSTDLNGMTSFHM